MSLNAETYLGRTIHVRRWAGSARVTAASHVSEFHGEGAVRLADVTLAAAVGVICW
jgi:hypothetical protein